jgi:hypothetical protein
MKALFLTLFCLSFGIFTFSQTANISQSKKLGGSGNDIISKSCMAFGQLWTIGFSNSPEMSLMNSKDLSYYAWIYGLTTDGDSLMTRCIGGSGDDIGTCIMQGGPNNLLIGGYTKSTDQHFSDLPDYGNTDAFLAIVDTTGYIMWKNKYGGSENDYLLKVIRTSNDGFILLGESSSSDGNVPDYEFESGADAWAFRLSPTLDSIWSKKFGGPQTQYFVDGIGLDDGNIILAGAFQDAKSGIYDFMVLKLNSVGEMIWWLGMGGLDNDHPQKLIKTNDENFLIFGSTESEDLYNYIGGTDGYVAKFNADGDTIWTQTLGWSNSDEIVLDVFEYNNQNYALLTSNQNTEFTNYGDFDLVLVEFGENHMNYIEHFGGENTEPFSEMGDTNIEYIGDGKIMVSTTTNSNNYDLTDSLGNADAWVFTIDILTNIETNSFSQNFEIFPNPANDKIQFQFSEYEKFPIEAKIMDIEGRIIQTIRILSKTTSINISNLKSGQYFVKTDNPYSKPVSFIKE